MTKRKPDNTAASVRQRLLNLAKERGEDFAFILTIYAAERLMYRIDKSNHGSDFILKGAMLFHLGSTRLSHRPTKDVDLLGKGEPEPARLVELFRDICATNVVDDGLVFIDKSIRAERIRDDEEYEGVRVNLEGRIGSARIHLQIDIGFGDALTPPPKKVKLATLLDLPAPSLRVYPWETVIAEKYHAMVDIGMANSRMKDYFDLHYLAGTLPFDGALLAKAIHDTFERRRTPIPTDIPIGLSAEFATDKAKQTQWGAFVSRIREDKEKYSLGEVVEKLRGFLLPPVEALRQKETFKMRWEPRGPWHSP